MSTMEGSRIWSAFPEPATRIRDKHEAVGLSGHHDWVHAYRVGEVARQVTLDEWGDERVSHLAGLAGLSHNADRLLQKEMNVGRRQVPSERVADLVASWVCGSLNQHETDQVVDAVMKHDGKNASDDSQVLIALMDGDRVVNLDTDLFPRSGQYYADLPVVDYQHFLQNPQATYRDPKSVLRDIAYSLDWVDRGSPVCVRTNLGKRMADTRAGIFKTFVTALQTQLEEEGIMPFPFKS